MRKSLIKTSGFIYRNIVRKILFLFNSEAIHELLINFGEMLGKSKSVSNALKFTMKVEDPILEQSFFGIKFQNPIGLAAGFDYNAQLTQIVPAIGFGFGSIGTITNFPYEGNLKPRLGRLVESRSLMVNKGFKNNGIKCILGKLKKSLFEIPIGLSIGRTNTRKLTTQKQSISDIADAFKTTERSKVNFSYYELNISCPNLIGNISFYAPEKLEQLLMEIKKLESKKPLFIKMPIDKNDGEIMSMLNIIVKYPVQGVIFGNLQKNRNDSSFNPEEIKKYKIGNFSGKPTEKRSNELIKLAYKNFGKSLLIIGCGGVFNAENAYTKIKLGASLIQLITGMIFEGPQLAAEINLELIGLLKKDGFNHISEAIGIDVS